MQYKKMFIGIFSYILIFTMSLNCAQEKTLQQFFADRVSTSIASHYNISNEELSTFFPTDAQSAIQCFYDKDIDIDRWQINAKRKDVGAQFNNVCLSEKENLIACGGKYYATVYNNNLLCTDLALRQKTCLSSKLYNLPHSDSVLLLCSSNKGDICLRDITQKKDLVVIKHGAFTNAIDLDISNKKIITGSDDNNACIWDCKGENDTFLFEPHLLLTLPHGDTVWKTVISNDGTKLATACLDGHARVFDMLDGKLLCDVEHTEQVCFVHITEDNEKLISAADDGYICVTNIISDKDNSLVLNMDGAIWSLSVGNHDTIIGAGSKNGVVKAWDLSSDSRVLFEKKFPSSINHLSFNDDSTLLAVATGNDNEASSNCAYLFDLVSGNELYKINYDLSASYAVLNKRGSMLITTSNNGTITISRKYSSDQTYLRKLFFLWTLIKRIDSNISVEEYLQDIMKSLHLDFSVYNVWQSFDPEEIEGIWSKCVNIMKEREMVLKEVTFEHQDKKRLLEDK